MTTIHFKENFNERISRFEQSDIQRENKKFSVVTYYSNGVSFGSSRTIEMNMNGHTYNYLKHMIPHNQVKREHIKELYEQLEDLVTQRGEFDPYWVALYKHQTDYTTFVDDNNDVYQIIGKGNYDIDYYHKIIHNVDIVYCGQMPKRMHFWKAKIINKEVI